MVVFLTGACRDQRRVRFEYVGGDGSASEREVEPYRLVQMDQRWRLLAFDPDRSDWRTFRLDRMRLTRSDGARFSPRPAPDPAGLLASADAYYQRHRATVLVEAPVEVVARRLPPVVAVERVDEKRCRVYATGESAYGVAVNLLLIDQDFTVEDTSPAVLDALRQLRDRITTATAHPSSAQIDSGTGRPS